MDWLWKIFLMIISGETMYFIIVLAVVVMLAMIIGRMSKSGKKSSLPPPEPVSTVVCQTILAEIKNMLEVGVVRKNFKSVVHFSAKDKLIGPINRPFSKREFTIEYIGTIVCGCDLELIQISPNGEAAKIIVPHCRVLHSYIDQNSIKVHNQSAQAFSSGIKLEEQNAELAVDLQANQNAAINEGLLEQAESNVRAMIMSLVERKGLKAEVFFIDGGRPSQLVSPKNNLIQ